MLGTDKFLYYCMHPLRAAKRIEYNGLLSGSYQEIFVEEAYKWLFTNLKPNTTLLDIGANIGDTALYFSISPCVRTVLAYEANPETYKIARLMVAKSPRKSKIHLINSAIGIKNTYIYINKAKQIGDKQFKVTLKAKGVKIKQVSLNTALRGLTNVAIKCDIEGAEHSIFNRTTDLKNVYALQIEYHYGYKDIKKTLIEKGFHVYLKKNYLCAIK